MKIDTLSGAAVLCWALSLKRGCSVVLAKATAKAHCKSQSLQKQAPSVWKSHSPTTLWCSRWSRLSRWRRRNKEEERRKREKERRKKAKKEEEEEEKKEAHLSIYTNSRSTANAARCYMIIVYNMCMYTYSSCNILPRWRLIVSLYI